MNVATVEARGQGGSNLLPFELGRARETFESLIDWLFSCEVLLLPLHEVEVEQEERARELSRRLLQAHLQARGVGDVGPALVVNGQKRQAVHTHRRDASKKHKSIFGEVTVHRLAYAQPGETSICPQDEKLSLPRRKLSYELQRRMVKGSVQGPFSEAVERVEEGTGVRVSKRTVEEIVQEASVDFEAFYEQRQGRAVEPEEIVVA